MDKSNNIVQIILCLKTYLKNICGPHYPTELIKFIVMLSLSKIKISCGRNHTIIRTDGKIYTHGANSLSMSDTLTSITRDIRKIKCSHDKIFYLSMTGNIYLWSDPSLSFRNLFLSNTTKKPIPYKFPMSDIKKFDCCHYELIILTKSDKLYTIQYKIKSHIIPNVKKIKCGYDSCFALTNRGSLYSYGSNIFGQLGLGNYSPSNSFQKVPLENVIAIACGYYHVMTLICKKNSNKLYVWGRNDYGELGLGDNKSRHWPTRLRFPPEEGTGPFETKTTIKSICCGADHSMVLLENNSIYVWGFNEYGQLGLGHYNNIHLPQKLYLRNDITKLYSRGNSTFAITNRNEIYSWGSNECGQLGFKSEVNHNIPIPTKL